MAHDIIDKLLIEQDYVFQLSGRLERFLIKRRSPFQAVFRCDVCGDSATDKSKRRGGFIEKDYKIFFHCFNCGASETFSNYLKQYHYDLYQSYLTDMRFNKKRDISTETKYEYHGKTLKVKNPIKGLQPISEVADAQMYVMKRQIPKEKWDKLYYTDKFYEYINSIKPDTFSDKVLKYDHPRLVIPFFDSMEGCFGVQGRSFVPDDKYRYITIIFDEDKKKVYGLEDIDYNDTIYCTEGPIDSYFIPNCIAMAGSDISDIDKNIVIILDNEPRNKEIVQKYDKYITAGHKIVIWPDGINEKDINEMVLAGKTQGELLSLIERNTFQSIKAKIRLNKWRKV